MARTKVTIFTAIAFDASIRHEKKTKTTTKFIKMSKQLKERAIIFNILAERERERDQNANAENSVKLNLWIRKM